MKKIISIALFGENHAKYAVYLSAFARAHANIYPRREGWELHVHIDQHVADSWYGMFLKRLEQAGLLNVTLFLDTDTILTKAMLWRLAPVFGDADFVFCRDLDATPMPRDRACMETFIRSGCVTHTALDNLAHAGIMGGLSGFWAPRLRKHTGWQSLDDAYKAAQIADAEYAHHGMDQIALNRLLDCPTGPLLLEHRYNGWAEGKPGVNPARAAGTYRCKAMSTPTPDIGYKFRDDWDLSLRMEADKLGNHLGCAGYPIGNAVHFWDKYGDSEIAQVIKECESC